MGCGKVSCLLGASLTWVLQRLLKVFLYPLETCQSYGGRIQWDFWRELQNLDGQAVQQCHRNWHHTSQIGKMLDDDAIEQLQGVPN